MDVSAKLLDFTANDLLPDHRIFSAGIML